jgi:hypothetical protein
MGKELEIGKDYGAIFGLDSKNGQHMIYNGDDNWTAINGEVKMTDNSPETTIEAINNLFLMPDYKDGIETIGNIGYRRVK